MAHILNDLFCPFDHMDMPRRVRRKGGVLQDLRAVIRNRG